MYPKPKKTYYVTSNKKIFGIILLAWKIQNFCNNILCWNEPRKPEHYFFMGVSRLYLLFHWPFIYDFNSYWSFDKWVLSLPIAFLQLWIHMMSLFSSCLENRRCYSHDVHIHKPNIMYSSIYHTQCTHSWLLGSNSVSTKHQKEWEECSSK